MRGPSSLVWLGLTPEPERELPQTVAALRARTRPPGPDPAQSDPAQPDAAELDAAERRRVEQLILHGTQRSWLRYLAEVTALVTAVADGTAPGDPGQAQVAAEVVLDHHRLLIGLPGPGYARAAAQRAELERALRILRGRSTDAGPRHGAAPRAEGGRG